MGTKKALKKFDVDPEVLEKSVKDAFGDDTPEDLPKLYEDSIKNFNVDTIIKGKVIRVLNNEVLVDIGYKSEGVIPASEFENLNEVKVGDEIEVLLEAIEDESGLVALSKRKADRIRGWERVISTHKEGDVVKGKAIRKIKGGLLVDIGVPVFLPASQVNIRRPGDIAEYIGQEVTCKILKIDEERRNIVISRRQLLEERREEHSAQGDKNESAATATQRRPSAPRRPPAAGRRTDGGGTPVPVRQEHRSIPDREAVPVPDHLSHRARAPGAGPAGRRAGVDRPPGRATS